MPELPEVETIRRSLLPKLTGVRIARVTVRERRLRQPIAEDFERRLRGKRILDITRAGKYLLFALGDEQHLLVHLGMSGSLEIKAASAAPQPHDHVRFVLDGARALVFNDARRFGLLRVARMGEFGELAQVGPDPLAEAWSAARLRALVRQRQRPIKNILMDQTLIAGIGNIYANEICREAGIRPTRRGHSLRRRELEALAHAIPAVLERAVRLGGSSIAD